MSRSCPDICILPTWIACVITLYARATQNVRTYVPTISSLLHSSARCCQGGSIGYGNHTARSSCVPEAALHAGVGPGPHYGKYLEVSCSWR
jgi:hypothetical protein